MSSENISRDHNDKSRWKCLSIELWYVCECPWTDCTLDVPTRPYTHYARWLPIFINDLKQLKKEKHPQIYKEFNKVHFTSKNTKRKCSSLPEDQAHEENNKIVKIDGGAIGKIRVTKKQTTSAIMKTLMHTKNAFDKTSFIHRRIWRAWKSFGREWYTCKWCE